MKGSPSFITQCFEHQRALLALTFEQSWQEMMAIHETFKDNMLQYVQEHLAPPPPPPVPVPVVDDSSSSIAADYSSSSSLSSPDISFVEESDSSAPPPTYSAAVMDEWFNAEKLPEKRNRKKRTFWSPSDHANEKDNGPAEDVGQDTPIAADVKGFKHFIGDFSRGDAQYALLNVWFQKTWGRQLDGIRDNLGREGKNKECKQLFNDIIARSLSNDPVEVTPSGHDGLDVCALCNLKKRCTQQVNGHLLAICCAQLAKALIGFFGYIWECKQQKITNWTQRFITASDRFGDVLVAHGEKGNGKRWKK